MIVLDTFTFGCLQVAAVAATGLPGVLTGAMALSAVVSAVATDDDPSPRRGRTGADRGHRDGRNAPYSRRGHVNTGTLGTCARDPFWP